MRALSQSSERDALLDGLLAGVPDYGWTWRAMRHDGPSRGPEQVLRVREQFPAGAPQMIEAFCDLADRRMLQGAALLDPELRPSQRLRATLALRFSQNRRYRDAVRRAAAIMALPGQAGLAARCTYRTVDALWSASGDHSVDLSWYTKRASLALVYSATLIFWLQDASPDDEETMAFFDRRVAGLRTVGRLRARLTGREVR